MGVHKNVALLNSFVDAEIELLNRGQMTNQFLVLHLIETLLDDIGTDDDNSLEEMNTSIDRLRAAGGPIYVTP